MPIEVGWLNEEKTIILRQFIGNWTWDEFHASQNSVNAMLKSVDYTVEQVIDVSASSSLPGSALSNFSAANRTVPKNAGIRVVVGSNTFYQIMFNILSKIFPDVAKHVVLVRTMDEARKILVDIQAKRDNDVNAST